MPTRPSKSRAPSPRRRSAPSAVTPTRRKKAARRKPSRPRAEQPLGVGVADAFAVERLKVPASLSRARPDDRLREVGWAEFGDLARELSERIGAEFQPEVVLGVANGGVFLGGALANTFRAEFRPIRVRKYGRRTVAQAVSGLGGKKVLVVDDVTVSGQTLRASCASAERSGAAEVRTAAMVVRPEGHHADWYAVETDELVVFGWDYQLHGGEAGGGDPGEFGV